MIHFHSDQVDMPTLPFITVKGWMQRVIASHGKREGMIHVIFCSDERILAINVSFLQHDYYTDIITFDTGAGETISGDVYISLDTVASNAHLLSIPTEKELLRVIIHGILHLCGYPDKQPDEAAAMRLHEDNALAMYL
ncbi:MAG TPA: rRNA maturation RNase YbeY [Bacteroidales bacterium]|jgi:rRNA maturation RNase YbeY|nr:MAG: Endoribonuclease YbeY [Bacteroidetes bacterium ADurb.Bin416]HBL71541.1 rRNA maturation RNase YbeY [Bacteroidales bacterium]